MTCKTILITALLFCNLSPLEAADRAAKPNIVFIMVDDAGIGDISAYACKYGTTPNIDRLAKEGMRFTRAYSGSAVCAPTRCVLMTGLHTGHGLRRANDSRDGQIFLPPGQMTPARLLQDSGYATGGFGKWGLGNPGSTGVPEKQGFDLFYGYYDQRHAHDHYTPYLIRNSAEEVIPGNAKNGRTSYIPTLIADETLKFIEDHKDRPFFCYAAWTPPHGKYEIPSDAPYSDEAWPEKVKNYAAMVSLIDRDVGRVMQKLKDLGLGENTLVIFTSDNGANQEFIGPLGSTGGLRGYKRMLYEGGIRAPFIARWPGRIKAGTTSELLTSHVDFMATAADLAGEKLLGKTDGISILPTLLGEEQKVKHESLYFEIYEPFFQQAVTTGDWKGYRLGTGAPLTLFDLKADPAEKNDVASQHPEITKRMEQILAREHMVSPHWDAPTHPEKNLPKKLKAKNRQPKTAP